MKRSGLFLIVTFLLSVACTEKGKPYAQHEGKRVTNESPGGETPSEVESISPALNGMSLSVLADRVLDPKSIRDAKTLVSRQAQDELITLNRKILSAAATEQKTAEFQALLKRYASALQTDCNGFVDGCLGLAYFKRAPSSAQVAKLIAKNNSSLYFKMLQYALKLKSSDWDPEVPEMLLRKPESSTDEQHAKAVQSMLEMALQSIQNRNPNVKENRRFLESIKAWSLVTNRDWARSDAGGLALFTMLADTGMLYAADGSLHEGLKQNIALQTQNPKGFMQQQKNLAAQKDFKVEAIGVKLIPEMDEMLYIIDAVYTGAISSEGGVRLFASSKRSGADLEIAAQNYLRMQFVSSLLESTRLAKKIFDSRVQVEDMFFNAIRESATIQSLWSTFRSRVLPLQTFVIKAARQRPDSTEIENNLRTLFDSVDKTISLTSVYPHQMVLFHLMSQKRFRLTMHNGKVAQSDDVIRLLFEGAIPPLFRYVENDEPMGQLELLHAFDMSIRTNLMQSAGVDPDYFIADTVTQFSTRAVTEVDTGLGRIFSYLDQNGAYDTFRMACEEFRSGRLQPRQHYFAQNRVSPYYGSTIQSAFASIESGHAMENFTSPIVTSSTNAYMMYMDKGYSELVEIARLDLGNSLRNGESMLASYRSYLKLVGLNDAQIEQKTVKTRKVLDRLRALRERVLTLSKKWYSDIGFCFYPAAVRDIQIQEQLIETEKTYLRSIHRKLKALRDPSVSAAEKQAITASIRMSGLPSGFTGQDKFVDGGFNLSQIDFLIRTARYLREGLRTDREIIKPIAPHIIPDFGQKLDLNVVAVRSSLQTIIPYSENEDTFVNSCLQVYFKIARRYVTWFGDDLTASSYWDVVTRSMISLHRFEQEVRGKSTIVQPEDIFKMHEKIIKFAEITPVQRALFQVTGLSEKFKPLTFDTRMLRWDANGGRITNLMGMYDLPVKQAEEEMLGRAWDGNSGDIMIADVPMRLTYITAGNQYYLLRSGRSRTIIPFSSDLDKHLTTDIRRFIQSEIQTIRGFHQTANGYFAKVQSRPEAERPRFDYNMFGSSSSPLVDGNLMRSWEYKIQVFNQRTGNCFEAGKTCPQFGETSTTN